MSFEDWAQQNVAVADKPADGFDNWQQQNTIEPLPTPLEIDASARTAFDISQEHGVSLDEGQQLVAGPEPSAFGRMMSKIKDLADEYIIRPYQVKPEKERWLKMPLATVAQTESNLTLGALDVLTNKTMGDKTFADMVLRINDLSSLSESERAEVETIGYVAAFAVPGMAVSKGLGLTKGLLGKIPGVTSGAAIIPRAAKALETILQAKLTFESTEAALQFSNKLVTGQPMDWSRVKLQGDIGALFGVGEVAVFAAMSGLAKGVEKYWGSKGIEVAEKIRGKYAEQGRPVPTLKEQVAKQEAEIISDTTRYKETFLKGRNNWTPEDKQFIEDIQYKYRYGKVSDTSAFAEPKPPEEVKPAVTEIKKPSGEPVAVKTPETGVITAKKATVPQAIENEFVKYEGIQEGVPEAGVPDEKLYTLKQDIPGHPAGSTLTESTLREAGIELPVEPAIIEPMRTKQPWEMTFDEWLDYKAKFYYGKDWRNSQIAISYINQLAKRPTKGKFKGIASGDELRIDDIQQALSEGKPVPASVLAEYKGEPWAATALAKQVESAKVETKIVEEKRATVDSESEQDLLNHIDNPPTTTPPPARNKGIALVPPQVEEVLTFLEHGIGAAKGAPTALSYAIKGAANFIESTYKIPEGKELAEGIRRVAFKTDQHKATQMQRIEKDAKLDSLNEAERTEFFRLAQGRIEPGKVSSKVLSVEKQVRTIWDEDLDAANIAGYKRKVGDKWLPLKRTERWMPQLQNKEGQHITDLAKRKGLGHPKVAAACDAMVAMKSAVSPEEALDKLLKYNDLSMIDGSLRGIDGNLESTRTLLPEYMVETDPAVILPKVLATNAKMLAAAEEWHIMSPETKSSGVLFKDMSIEEIKAAEETGTASFEKLEPILGAIRTKYSPGDARNLRKWVNTSFGGGNDIPVWIENTLNFINNTETRLKISYAMTGALRNMFQGPGNLFTASPLDTIKGLWNALELTKEGKRISEIIRRSGAIHGVKEMGEIIGGGEHEPGMRPFLGAEHWSQKSAASVALQSRLKTNIQDLANYQKGGTLDKILTHLKYISVNPNGYLKDLIKNRTFVNPITDEQLETLYTRPPTLDEMQQVAYRVVVDSQFAQTLASKPIPWNNPFFRTAMKFKTYSINQTRWVWNEAVKQALKGTYRPLLLYFAYSATIGEIWNLSRDLIRGGDNSITSMLTNREEKRNAKDLTMAIFNDFTDGTGLGIIADLGYGLGSLAMGPVGGTAKNIVEWGGNLRHPLTATEKLARQEYTMLRDLGGLFNRFDAWFINQNNKYFDYVRTRDRTFEFAGRTKKATFEDKAWQTARRMLAGPVRYEGILPYEYAARQITVGDIDDAADYLADAIRNDSRDTDAIRDSIEGSMRDYSPLGRLSEDNKAEFMKQFDPAERRSMETLQTKWLADYAKATNKAFKLVGNKNTLRNYK